jgi:hypothetical protein
MTMLTTPTQIATFRLLTLRSMLRLELHGMTRRGRSAYAIIKSEFNLKGSKQKVFDQYNAIVEDALAEVQSTKE